MQSVNARGFLPPDAMPQTRRKQHIYQCVGCGWQWESDRKLYAGEVGYVRGHPWLRANVSKSEFRLPCYDVLGNGLTALYRIQTLANVSCLIPVCNSAHVDYYGYW